MPGSGDPRPQAAVRALAAAARGLISGGPLALARMGGSSIAEPGAAGWVTDFLNAAYYARPVESRDVDDLRLAFAVLNSCWHDRGRRLRLGDLRAFHRAFGGDRSSSAGRLGRRTLLAGAERLLGGDFSAGYADRARRGWGIVFADERARAAFEPQRRMRDCALRELTPPRRPVAEQSWHTYEPVPVPSAGQALATLAEPDRWPEFGSDLGRFTALRSGGLPGQTFEIELVAKLTSRAPVFQRAYVTATRLVTRGEGDGEVDRYFERLADDMAAGEPRGDSRPMPPGARGVAALELTTHAGHVMGAAISRVLVFEHEGRAYIRDVGSWDPLPPHLALPYKLGGHRAQMAFWGDGEPEQSMLHQIALRAAERPPA